MEILKSIGSAIAGTWMAISSFFGIQKEIPQAPVIPIVATESQNLGGFNPAGGLTYRLQASVGTTDTTVRLSSFKNRSGLALTMGSNSLNTSIGYGTLDPQNPTRSEFISFTGVTQNTDGTAILTGVTRGLSDIFPYTASTTLRLSHSGQSIFILSDSPQHFSEYAVKQNAQLISGQWTASSTAPLAYDNLWYATAASSTNPQIQSVAYTYNNYVRSKESTTVTATTTYSSAGGIVLTNAPSNATDAANKAYVDGVALVSAPNADYTTRGVVEQATVTELNAGTANGGTGARLFINPSDLLNSNYASSTSRSFATSTTGYLQRSISMSANQTVLFWGTCERAGTGNFSLSYRVVSKTASTTLVTFSQQANTPSSASSMFTATTTSTVIVAASSDQGCDTAGSLLTLVMP
ncbi:MAG: hypothetical protein V4438_04240 [Patescibacteria group bacterium]